MRAVQFSKYGGPDVLEIVDVAMPVATSKQVIVRITATSINSVDTETRSGRLRLLSGRRFPQGTGLDFTGTISALGDEVTGLAIGERVWGLKAGFFTRTTGGAAEYLAIEAKLVTRMPSNVNDIEAAALPAVGATAVAAVIDHGAVAAGDRVLVRGGSGGVGSAVVQLAHSRGAHVTALTGAKNQDFVLQLGADVALDYQTTKIDDLGTFDVVIDTVGSDVLRLRRHLAPRERMVAVAFGSPATLAAIAWSWVHGSRRIRTFFGQPAANVIVRLTELVEAGSIRPVIDSIHTLENIAETHRAHEAGGGRGKRVVAIGDTEA
ncbi:NAD(P)-dependent alcohol dehydrogenase [Glaciibacter superstes]|uniref:NAD(P)-dependent alcohol dehydrogenase n=1 Tax=Glaciibacter superstes TaxID=501023 RepID=UPI0003B50D3E|nr:NAD(P)-dependent alcohol dehydrogenase [Glaciibacter superstes]